MSKALIIGAVAMVGTTAAVITGYVSPAAPSQTDVPAIVIAMPQDEVMATLRGMTAENYILHSAGEDEPIPDFVEPSVEAIAANHVRFGIKIWDDVILEVDATVTALAGQQTEVDITARLPDSKFRRSEALHPYDIAALESTADLVVTDYVDSVLRGKRMASKDELEREFVRRLGFSKQQAREFTKRVETVFRQAYADDIRATEAQKDDDSYAEIDGSPEYAYYGDVEEQADAAAGAAAEAASAAANATAAAADAAGRAADEARWAAEY